WGRLRPELIYSRMIAPMRFQHSSRRTAARVLSGIKRADDWSPSCPRLMGRILEEDPMSNFVRAVSLRIGGFLVVLGGFLIFASMKAKAVKTESLPPPPAGGFVSSDIEFGGFSHGRSVDLALAHCRGRRVDRVRRQGQDFGHHGRCRQRHQF